MGFLEYPEELHDHHSDYPLAPERMSVKPTDLSTYQLDLLKSLYSKEFQPSESHEKLIPNLRNKEEYIFYTIETSSSISPWECNLNAYIVCSVLISHLGLSHTLTLIPLKEL